MILNCDKCGKEFKKQICAIKRSKKHFCSTKCMGEFNRLDLIGQKTGELEVLEFDCITSDGRSKFKCECSCGRIVSIYSNRLREGNKRVVKSCVKCKNRGKYIGKISGSYFCHLKSSAKARKIPFEITQEDIWLKYIEQDEKCIFSNLMLTWQDGKNNELGTASVDRKDSLKGYTRENIQIIHKHINWMKLNHNQEYFLELCKKVANFDKNFTPILDYDNNKKQYHRTGYGEISGSYWNDIKNNAKQRGITFNVNIEDCWNLYLRQGGICALSGIPIKFETCGKTLDRTASLDRIGSLSLDGYVISNVQWVHKDINQMKWDFSDEYLIFLCKQIKG